MDSMALSAKKAVTITGLVLLAIVLAVGAALLLLYAIPVSHPSFNRRCERMLVRRLALDSCGSKKVSLKVFKGVSITDLVMVRNVGNRKKVRISLPVVAVEYRFVPVFKALFFNKRPATHRKPVSDNKDNRAVSAAKRQGVFSLPTLYAVLSSKSLRVSPWLQMISCEKGAAFIDSQGVAIAAFEGVTGEMLLANAATSHADIALGIEKAALYGINAHDNELSCTMDSSRCSIKTMKGTIFGGKAVASMDLDLAHDSIIFGAVALKGASLAELYALADGTEGSLKGKGDLHLDILPGIAHTGLLQAKGTVSCRDVFADRIAVLKQFALLTGLGSLSAVTFRNAEASFTLSKGVLSSADIRGDGDPLSLKMSGWVRTRDGYFNLNVYGVFEKHYRDSVNTIVWESLFPEDKGRRSFRCKVYGTPASPSVSLDKELAKRAVNTAVKSLEKEIQAIKSILMGK